MPTRALRSLLVLAVTLTPRGAAQDPEQPPVAEAQATGVRLVLGMQEGDPPAEWPYEGVYRVRGRIPIGYRVGGTAIAAAALVQSPADEDEIEAPLERALEFVIGALDDPLMDPEYAGGYDVRGWGHCYALALFTRLQRLGRVPQGFDERVRAATRAAIDALQRIEIPESGGWAYARARQLSAPSPASPFMTAPCLQALFEAAALGYEVDGAVIERGLAALERGRLASGAVAYAVADRPARDRVPGSIGRMLATETTLALAGRATTDRVRGALDAFLVHWRWLDARRAQSGTHVAPYGVAPYYFYYAHYHAALAIELLPEPERAEYRARLYELLFSVRLEDGAWNDRVFERSANYGTSIALLVLSMPEQLPPSRWDGGASKAVK
jgi:hypothetical protein